MDDLVERLRAIDSMEEAWLAIEEAADRIEKLEAERQDIAYHAEQMSTYLAQPTISEKNLTSARRHNDKIRAALVSAPPSPVVPDERL